MGGSIMEHMRIFLSAVLVAALAASTPHLTVATSASAATAKPRSKVSLFVDVIPDPKIHVYAPGVKDYIPIALTLAPPKDVTLGKVQYPKSEDLFFEPLNEHVPVYQSPFRLVQDATLGPSFKPGQAVTLTGTLKYQACDDKVCFAPASAPVSWTITVAEAASGSGKSTGPGKSGA